MMNVNRHAAYINRRFEREGLFIASGATILAVGAMGIITEFGSFGQWSWRQLAVFAVIYPIAQISWLWAMPEGLPTRTNIFVVLALFFVQFG